MIKKYIALLLALSLATVSMTACQQESNMYYADVEEGEGLQQTETGQSTVSLKFTDYINSNTVSGVAISPADPYFKSQLNEASQKALEEIVAGIIDYKEYITLNHSITEEELYHIMNIVMTNVPDIFHCDFTYKYDLNVSGYIRNFYPVYTMDYQTYYTNKDSIERSLIDMGADKGVKEYEFLSKAYQKAYSLSSPVPVQEEPLSTDKSIPEDEIPLSYTSQTIIGTRGKNEYTSLGASKYIQYCCSYMGIPCMTVVGELIGSDYGLPEIYPSDVFKVRESDEIYTVKMDINNYHAWNIVNIGGIWVNCDAWLDKYLNNKDQSPYGSFFCVPDEITRQTRLFNATNDILGLSPSCSSHNFQQNAREMYYITSYSDDDIKLAVDTVIETIDFNDIKDMDIQFETEANYKLFESLFPTRMELYNQTHNNIIPRYTLKTNDYSLVISVNNIVFSEK